MNDLCLELSFGVPLTEAVIEPDAPADQATKPADVADSGWTQTTEETPVQEVAQVSGDYVALSLSVPASKLDKVMSAIGRALK